MTTQQEINIWYNRLINSNTKFDDKLFTIYYGNVSSQLKPEVYTGLKKIKLKNEQN